MPGHGGGPPRGHRSDFDRRATGRPLPILGALFAGEAELLFMPAVGPSLAGGSVRRGCGGVGIGWTHLRFV